MPAEKSARIWSHFYHFLIAEQGSKRWEVPTESKEPFFQGCLQGEPNTGTVYPEICRLFATEILKAQQSPEYCGWNTEFPSDTALGKMWNRWLPDVKNLTTGYPPSSQIFNTSCQIFLIFLQKVRMNFMKSAAKNNVEEYNNSNSKVLMSK